MNRANWEELQVLKKLGYVIEYVEKQALICSEIIGHTGYRLSNTEVLFVPNACVFELDDGAHVDICLKTSPLYVHTKTDVVEYTREQIASRCCLKRRCLYHVPLDIVMESMIPEECTMFLSWPSQFLVPGYPITITLAREEVLYQPKYELLEDMSLQRTDRLADTCTIHFDGSRQSVLMSYVAKPSWKTLMREVLVTDVMEDYLAYVRKVYQEA